MAEAGGSDGRLEIMRIIQASVVKGILQIVFSFLFRIAIVVSCHRDERVNGTETCSTCNSIGEVTAWRHNL